MYKIYHKTALKNQNAMWFVLNWAFRKRSYFNYVAYFLNYYFFRLKSSFLYVCNNMDDIFGIKCFPAITNPGNNEQIWSVPSYSL